MQPIVLLREPRSGHGPLSNTGLWISRQRITLGVTRVVLGYYEDGDSGIKSPDSYCSEKGKEVMACYEYTMNIRLCGTDRSGQEGGRCI